MWTSKALVCIYDAEQNYLLVKKFTSQVIPNLSSNLMMHKEHLLLVKNDLWFINTKNYTETTKPLGIRHSVLPFLLIDGKVLVSAPLQDRLEFT